MLADNDAHRAYASAKRLLASLPVDVTPAERVQAMVLLARTEYELGMIGRADKHAGAALNLAKGENDLVGRIEADLVAGLVDFDQGDVDSTTAAVDDAIEILKGADSSELRAKTLLQAASMYYQFKRYDRATELAMQAVDIGKQSGNPLVEAYVHKVRAMLLDQSGRIDEAVREFRRMLELAKAVHSSLLEADAMLSLGKASASAGDFVKGGRLARDAVATCRRVGVHFCIGQSLLGLADIHMQSGKPDKALPLLDQAIDIYEGDRNITGLWEALSARSKTLQGVGRLAKAEVDAEKADRLAKRISLVAYRANSSHRLAEVAAALGNYKQAYALSAKAAVYATRSEDDLNARQIQRLAERYRTDSKQHRIEKLQREAEEHRSERRWLWTVISGGVLLLSITILFLLRQRRNNRLLATANAELISAWNERRAILEALPDPLFNLGLDGRYYDLLAGNRLPQDVPPPDAQRGRSLNEALPPDAVEVCMAALQEANETGRSVGAQFQLSLPDGQYWFELSVASKHVEPSAPPRFIALLRDISGRKWMEEALAERSGELAAANDALSLRSYALDRVSDSVALIDRSARIRYVNQEICRRLGYTETQLLNMCIGDIDSNWTMDRHLERWADHWSELHEQDGLTFETLLKTQHGEAFPVEVNANLFKHQGHTYILGIARDITERKNAELRLQVSERKFRTIVENTPDNIARYDLQGRVVYVNPRLEWSLRQPAVAVIGKTVRERYSGVYDNYADMVEAAILRGEPGEFEMERFRPESGTTDIYQILVVPELGDDREVKGALAIGRNVTELKRLEHELREQEQKYRTLVENALDFIVRYDTSLRRIYVNPAWEKANGLPAAQVLDRSVESVSEIGGSVREYIQVLERVLATGFPESVEFSIINAHGNELSLQYAVVPEFDETGKISSLLAVGRDISERKEAEKRLQESEQRFRTLAENFPDFLARFDQECRHLYVNPMVARAFGMPAQSFIGKRLHGLVRKDSTQQDLDLEECVRRAFISGEPNEYEAHWQTDMGEEIFEIRYVPEKAATDEVVSVLGIGRNVTRLRAAETALRASEQKFRTLVENAPNIIVRYDLDCRRTYFNPAFLRETTISYEQAINATPQWRSETTMPTVEYRTHLRRVMETGEPLNITVGWRKQDGEDAGQMCYHAMRIVAERDPEGKVIGALALGHDITELKDAERRLEDSRLQLREMSALREKAREEERKLVAHEIHDELGQVLTALKLGISTLRMQFAKDNPPLDERIRQLLNMSEHSIQVVREVARSLRPAALSLGVVSSLEWLATEFSRSSGIPCRIEASKETSHLDEEQAMALFRVVQEGLTNIARHADASRVDIIVSCDAGRCKLDLVDDGRGFDPAVIGGRAFGLLGMRERVARLRGEVNVDSVPGQGTRVRVELPLTRAAPTGE